MFTFFERFPDLTEPLAYIEGVFSFNEASLILYKEGKFYAEIQAIFYTDIFDDDNWVVTKVKARQIRHSEPVNGEKWNTKKHSEEAFDKFIIKIASIVQEHFVNRYPGLVESFSDNISLIHMTNLTKKEHDKKVTEDIPIKISIPEIPRKKQHFSKADFLGLDQSKIKVKGNVMSYFLNKWSVSCNCRYSEDNFSARSSGNWISIKYEKTRILILFDQEAEGERSFTMDNLTTITNDRELVEDTTGEYRGIGDKLLTVLKYYKFGDFCIDDSGYIDCEKLMYSDVFSFPKNGIRIYPDVDVE